MNVSMRDGTAIWSATPPEVSLFCSGDFCPRGRAAELILAGRSGELLAEVMPELQKSDWSIVNLEAPLTRSETPIVKSGPNLKGPPESVELLAAGGWDAVCCANNHIGDFGPDAVMETLELLAARGIGVVGAGKNLAAAREPLLITANGVKIALLAVAENEFGIATENLPGANPLQPLRNLVRIREAAVRADYTIVLIHGGNEFNPIPSPRMVDLCHAFAEAGASAVIAGHTHCPQGIELYRGVPIVYSLGNFLFDWDSDTVYQGYNWSYGYSVRLGFAAGRAVRLDVVPHVYPQHGDRIRLLRGGERERFLRDLDHLSHLVADEREVAKYFDAWCLRGINGYFSLLGRPFLPVDRNDPAAVAGLMAMRNLHTCEAHNELVTATLRIIAEEREEIAAEYLPRLECLCRGEI